MCAVVRLGKSNFAPTVTRKARDRAISLQVRDAQLALMS